jgi:ArsR family transcriptional regulator, cadmium/lead-responsive transcriptional repressor
MRPAGVVAPPGPAASVGAAFSVGAPGRYHRRMPMSESDAVRLTTTVPEVAVDVAAALTAAACLFRSLGDPTRLSVIRHLLTGPHRVVDLTAHLGLAQSSVSGALACLKDCGVAESRPQGRASLWSLTAPEQVLEVLAAAERLLAVTGDAVVLCPVFGAAAQR